MRKDVRRRLATLAVAGFAAALLSGNVAGAQPAAAGSGAMPNGCTEPPGCCPIMGIPERSGTAPQSASQNAAPGPLGGPPGCEPEPPNPPPSCYLQPLKPYPDAGTIYAKGSVICPNWHVPDNISLLVAIYKWSSSAWLEVARKTGQDTSGRSWLTLTAQTTPCTGGAYKTLVQATINHGIGYRPRVKSYGPQWSGQSDIFDNDPNC
jgi:hypothetical protein